MSKMVFIKYLPAVRGKLTLKLKLLRNSCLTLQVFRSRLLLRKSLIEQLPQVTPKLLSLNSNLDYRISTNSYEIYSCYP